MQQRKLYPWGSVITTLSHLHKRITGNSLTCTLTGLSSDKKRLQYLAEKTAEYTGLEKFPQYLTMLFEIDALFLNDDRHLNNIAVLEKNGKYGYCPIFDQGAALLSNTQLLPMDIEPKGLIPMQKARPLKMTFNRQIHIMRELYGKQLSMPQVTREEILEELAPILPYYAQRDKGLITDRVVDTILLRQRYQE